MEIKELKKLGFSDAEAKVYLYFFKVGKTDAKGIVNETSFYKANVYQILNRLCDKGIISKIIEDKKSFYQLQKPEYLLEIIRKKKEDLEAQEKSVSNFIKEIEMKKISYSETAIVLKGLSGVRQIYSEIINKKMDYCVFGSPSDSDKIIGDYYWQNLHVKQREYKIKAKMIFHKSLKYWKNMVPKDIIELRFLDEDFEPLTETTIYGTKVAFTVWTEKPVITIIDNEHVAQAYKQIFDILWSKAKP